MDVCLIKKIKKKKTGQTLSVTTRRPDRPASGPTSGSMLKWVKGLNRPGGVPGSRPDRSDRPARSGFKNIA
ncbi:hypothetical protein HanIR_Chr01g0021231 [Helianthus annuus]|nr:hypothetical protein HanIR_Chr01g0021231 [Helianthus annuus]